MLNREALGAPRRVRGLLLRLKAAVVWLHVKLSSGTPELSTASGRPVAATSVPPGNGRAGTFTVPGQGNSGATVPRRRRRIPAPVRGPGWPPNSQTTTLPRKSRRARANWRFALTGVRRSGRALGTTPTCCPKLRSGKCDVNVHKRAPYCLHSLRSRTYANP